MSKAMITESILTGIADAIRTRLGVTTQYKPSEMAGAISSIDGGSSGGSNGLAYDMGEFVLDADTNANKTVYVPHNLGEKPGFIIVWTDAYAGIANPDTTYTTSLGFVWLDDFMGLDNWYTSSAVGEGRGTTVNFTQFKGSTGMNVVKPSSYAYTIDPADVTDINFPLVTIANNIYWRAGITYHYFVSKAWWNVGGVQHTQ